MTAGDPQPPEPEAARPVLRLLPTPDREPGRDLGQVRARDHDGWSGYPTTPPESQGTLALTFMLPSGVPSDPQRPALRLLSPLPARDLSAPPRSPSDRYPGDEDNDDFGSRRTARADLPDPSLWAPRFLQAVVDVLAGDRPTQQLLRWTSDDVYSQIRHKAKREAQATVVRLRSGRRAAVRSTRVCEPADGIVEACATVRYLDRVRTVAFRLEGTDGRWRCTVLQFG